VNASETRIGHQLPPALSVVKGLVAEPPIVRVGPKLWELYDDYCIHGSNFKLYLPARFLFDGASIPRPFRNVMGIFDLSVVAPLGHDAIYGYAGKLPKHMLVPYRTFTRHEGDKEMFHWMTREDVAKWRREIAYNGVRVGGHSSFKDWRSNEKI
jgi:hypothetical protein